MARRKYRTRQLRVPIKPITLRIARTLKGISQTELADLAKVDQTTISDIEVGRIQNPSWGVVCRLAGALGVEPIDVFPIPEYLTDPPPSPDTPTPADPEVAKVAS